MDQELRAYLEDLKVSIVNDVRSTVVEDLKATMDERFAEQRRHTEILIEVVRSDVRLVAEGVAGVSERLEAFQADTARRLEEVQASFVLRATDLG
jgi:ribosomal 50S subunit-associated protein YjgA (DUF615 family)